MNAIRRECLLLKKRYLIWGILACVVLLSYLGFAGYLPFWMWRKYRLLVEMDRNILIEQQQLAKTLLWQSALCQMGLNRFNLIIPASLTFCSVGLDSYKKRFGGIEACGRKAWRSSYLVSLISNYLVTVGIVCISIWMQILRTRPQFQEVASIKDLQILGKPLLYLFISFFCYTAVSQLVSFFAGQHNIWFILPVSFLAIQIVFQVEEWITHILFPYGEGLYALLTSFFFSHVDRNGLILQQVPVIANQRMVEQGAYLILLFLLIVGMSAAIIGCLEVKKSVAGITSGEHINRNEKYEQSSIYVLYGNRFAEGVSSPALYYDNLDIRENLLVLTGAKKREIEKALALVELNRSDDREKSLKAFEQYPNKMLLYELAVARLCEDSFLELDRADRLDENDKKGYHELQRSLCRLTDNGCTVILYAEDVEKVQRLVNEGIEISDFPNV